MPSSDFGRADAVPIPGLPFSGSAPVDGLALASPAPHLRPPSRRRAAVIRPAFFAESVRLGPSLPRRCSGVRPAPLHGRRAAGAGRWATVLAAQWPVGPVLSLPWRPNQPRPGPPVGKGPAGALRRTATPPAAAAAPPRSEQRGLLRGQRISSQRARPIAAGSSCWSSFQAVAGAILTRGQSSGVCSVGMPSACIAAAGRSG